MKPITWKLRQKVRGYRFYLILCDKESTAEELDYVGVNIKEFPPDIKACCIRPTKPNFKTISIYVKNDITVFEKLYAIHHEVYHAMTTITTFNPYKNVGIGVKSKEEKEAHLSHRLFATIVRLLSQNGFLDIPITESI